MHPPARKEEIFKWDRRCRFGIISIKVVRHLEKKLSFLTRNRSIRNGVVMAVPLTWMRTCYWTASSKLKVEKSTTWPSLVVQQATKPTQRSRMSSSQSIRFQAVFQVGKINSFSSPGSSVLRAGFNSQHDSLSQAWRARQSNQGVNKAKFNGRSG